MINENTKLRLNENTNCQQLYQSNDWRDKHVYYKPNMLTLYNSAF